MDHHTDCGKGEFFNVWTWTPKGLRQGASPMASSAVHAAQVTPQSAPEQLSSPLIGSKLAPTVDQGMEPPEGHPSPPSGLLWQVMQPWVQAFGTASR
jgi:hypothetical protein